MVRVIQFPETPPNRHGYKRVRRKKRLDLEDYGQLNLFKVQKEARVISFSEETNPFEKAIQAEEEGQISIAREYYSKAVQRGQQISDAYCNLGIIASSEGEYAQALDFFTQSLGAEPRHLEAHYNLANLYSDMGNYPLGILHYEVAIQILPSFSSTYYNLALVFLETGKFEQAEQRLMQFNSLSEPEDKIQTKKLLQEIILHNKSKNNER